MTLFLAFVKRFLTKYLTTIALEKIAIIFIRELVERTDSKVDDEVYNALFNKTGGEE